MKALRINATCDKLGVGRSKVYELVRAGKLDARKLGNRTVITEESADAFLESLPRMGAEPPQAA
jgi:excisionase family DNA binding protein